MKIIIKNYMKNITYTIIEYLIEREKENYNNIVETVILSSSEIVGLSDDEIKTLGFKRIKPIAIRVFTQIEPLDEPDTPVDFELIDSILNKIEEKVKTKEEIEIENRLIYMLDIDFRMTKMEMGGVI